MISAVNPSQGQNFGSVVRIDKVIVNGNLISDPKEVNSVVNKFLKDLMKQNKKESSNASVIRDTFASQVHDYKIPSNYEKPLDSLVSIGSKIAKIEDKQKHIFYFLTGNHMRKLCDAGSEIRKVRSFHSGDKAAEKGALRGYGQVIKQIFNEAKNAVEVTIFAEKKGGKITPAKLEFSKEIEKEPSLFDFF